MRSGAGRSRTHGMRECRAAKGTAGRELSPRWGGWTARLSHTRGAGPRAPSRRARVPCVPRAASYLAAPGSRIGDPEPRGSRQPGPPLAPPPPAPPCRGARGRGSARGRRRGAGPEGRSAAPRPPSSPRPAHSLLPVDTCSAENPILQTLIERPASARHCARG